jgi:hypothetical protein
MSFLRLLLVRYVEDCIFFFFFCVWDRALRYKAIWRWARQASFFLDRALRKWVRSWWGEELVCFARTRFFFFRRREEGFGSVALAPRRRGTGTKRTQASACGEAWPCG